MQAFSLARCCCCCPAIVINNVTVQESPGGTVNAVFTVTLHCTPTTSVSVDFTTANDSATAGTDFTATAGVLTIPAGQTTGKITVVVTGDSLHEGNETFFVDLTNPTGCATILDPTGIGTITEPESCASLFCDPGGTFPKCIAVTIAGVTDGNCCNCASFYNDSFNIGPLVHDDANDLCEGSGGLCPDDGRLVPCGGPTELYVRFSLDAGNVIVQASTGPDFDTATDYVWEANMGAAPVDCATIAGTSLSFSGGPAVPAGERECEFGASTVSISAGFAEPCDVASDDCPTVTPCWSTSSPNLGCYYGPPPDYWEVDLSALALSEDMPCSGCCDGLAGIITLERSAISGVSCGWRYVDNTTYEAQMLCTAIPVTYIMRPVTLEVRLWAANSSVAGVTGCWYYLEVTIAASNTGTTGPPNFCGFQGVSSRHAYYEINMSPDIPDPHPYCWHEEGTPVDVPFIALGANDNHTVPNPRLCTGNFPASLPITPFWN